MVGIPILSVLLGVLASLPTAGTPARSEISEEEISAEMSRSLMEESSIRENREPRSPYALKERGVRRWQRVCATIV